MSKDISVEKSTSCKKHEEVVPEKSIPDTSKTNLQTESTADNIVDDFHKNLSITKQPTEVYKGRSAKAKEILEDPRKRAEMIAKYPEIYTLNSPENVIVLEKEDEEIWNIPEDAANSEMYFGYDEATFVKLMLGQFE